MHVPPADRGRCGRRRQAIASDEPEFDIAVAHFTPAPPVTGTPAITTPRGDHLRRSRSVMADRAKLIIGDRVDPAMVERIATSRRLMHHAQKASGRAQLMVTSALPSEGKTLTATKPRVELSESYQRRVC